MELNQIFSKMWKLRENSVSNPTKCNKIVVMEYEELRKKINEESFIESFIERLYEGQVHILKKAFDNKFIEKVEASQIKDNIPEFSSGDTVVVQIRVVEGTRERTQPFEGVVLGVKKRGLGSSFIVRKISNGIGVERTFQTHSPLISSIKVKRRGDVRQAKLFYLRERTGRSAKIKEKTD